MGLEVSSSYLPPTPCLTGARFFSLWDAPQFRFHYPLYRPQHMKRKKL
ncbi:hypothetical protein HMPREF0742_02143 [Rothia aeria F0184]|uniref:Uncharacterized protein n=1 Tax=Rothia aeria F0184 TaxID=888019 RepID=U7V240_9MICC|nr:hypothetical protein HMPREF0742_02143 [Rothia aeria F0184]